MEKRIELSESFLKFAKALIELSKANHKFTLYFAYKYFRSRKKPEKFILLLHILYTEETNLYLQEAIKAIILTKWRSFAKGMPGLINLCVNSDPVIINKGVHFSGYINRSRKEKKEANDWWKENRPVNF